MYEPTLQKAILALASVYPWLAQAAEAAPMLEEVEVKAKAEEGKGYRVESTSGATHTGTPLWCKAWRGTPVSDARCTTSIASFVHCVSGRPRSRESARQVFIRLNFFHLRICHEC